MSLREKLTTGFGETRRRWTQSQIPGAKGLQKLIDFFGNWLHSKRKSVQFWKSDARMAPSSGAFALLWRPKALELTHQRLLSPRAIESLERGKFVCIPEPPPVYPLRPNPYDLVYFGFCLYLLDRRDLFSAIAEADRVLKNGGFVAITDFDPISQHKRPYHHKDSVFSFKQDYSKFFTGSGMYFLVSKSSFSHQQPFLDVDGDERLSTTLLFKEMDAY